MKPAADGVKFSACQKSEHDCAGSGEVGDPLSIPLQSSGADKGANDELGDGADDDFRKGSGDAKPDSEQGCNQSETHP
jgi:hypothetical protein